eukprot:g16609.t1
MDIRKAHFPATTYNQFEAAMYSRQTTFIIVAFILLGAVRTLAAKVLFQLGFGYPMLLTLLYMLAQSVALPLWLVVHCLARCCKRVSVQPPPHTLVHTQSSFGTLKKSRTVLDVLENYDEPVRPSPISHRALLHYGETRLILQSPIPGSFPADVETRLMPQSPVPGSFLPNVEQTVGFFPDSLPYTSHASTAKIKLALPSRISTAKLNPAFSSRASTVKPNLHLKKLGSHVHSVAEINAAKRFIWMPWYVQAAVPSVCNVFKTVMRWGSLLFLSASVTEVLIGSTELVFALLAARFMQKRDVSCRRWRAVAQIIVGLLVFSVTDVLEAAHGDGGYVDILIGIGLVLGQSVFSVLQGLSEEISMQHGHVPALQLMGVEGIYGFILGVILYVPIVMSGAIKERFPSEITTPQLVMAVVWTVSVLLYGIGNILAAAHTSSMTRYIFKTITAFAVWTGGLIIYYTASEPDFGEAWKIPPSLIQAFGFLVICTGVYIYATDTTAAARVTSSQYSNPVQPLSQPKLEIAISPPKNQRTLDVTSFLSESQKGVVHIGYEPSPSPSPGPTPNPDPTHPHQLGSSSLRPAPTSLPPTFPSTTRPATPSAAATTQLTTP